ncbi:MAG TPA: glycine cleavage system aminomethyltransferase GcvT [Longimicrobiaceae bacterium]
MPLKPTPLRAEHVALGARLVPFAGYEMPVQYPTGITAEHQAVRTAAGLFDVSHMGEVEVRGREAREFVQYVTSNDVDRASVGQAQYSTLLKQDGGVVDDLLVYRFPEHFLLVVNASNREKDLAHLREHAGRFDVEIIDRSDDIALLALQGPRAQAILERLTGDRLDDIGYYHFREGRLLDRKALLSRTGYTGEDGFEIYLENRDAVPLWRALLEAGKAEGLIPAGLGARDTLRLEMGYALYGNDLDEEHTALEAGLGWVVKLGKEDFIGRQALIRQKEAGIERKLAGFRLRERGFPRPGYEVRTPSGGGVVTSGTVSPSLGVGIGLAYLPAESAQPGAEIEIVIRGQGIPAEVVKPPFYTQGSVRT